MPATEGFWAVVPAGGAGTRLWPLSRAASPKFLHDLTGQGRSLLQATVDRVRPLVGDRVVVVTGAVHAQAVREQLPELPPGRVLAEPSPRDSMAAIGLAAAVVEREDPDAVVGSFAADHVIPDADAFRACVAEAVEVARQGFLVTVGIAPTHPATGFGYVRSGAPVPGAATARHVVRFVEKPDAATAAGYLAGGDFRWNAGMFVARAAVLLDLLAEHHPDLARGVREVAARPDRLAEVWPGLTRISIDHAVAEPAADAGRVATVPGDFGWDDVGDFAGLGTLLPAVDDGPKVLGDDALVRAVDAGGLVVPAGGRLVAVLGLDDVVVVDTPDAVLVTTRARAQEVKGLTDLLRDTGRADLL
ncbi:MAG TPA: mannose-1-phosphate guanylyltransferase [Dermatophilaceae bacterium]|nr:mannose-1-phosphate guanylyltransferase [Dermatophilaceae bacterium]